MVAERLREAVECAALPGTKGTVVTISIGVAAMRGRMGRRFTAQDLIAAADSALYEAKRAGRNRLICVVPESATV